MRRPAGGRIAVVHTPHEQGAAYMAPGAAGDRAAAGAYAVVPVGAFPSPREFIHMPAVRGR
jgi:hypothetical protein